MKKIYTFFVVMLVLSFLSCNSSKKMANKSSKLSPLDIDFLKIDTTAGKRNVRLEIKKNETWNLRTCFPEKINGQPIPLVIALHWAGGGEIYKGFSECLIEPAFADMNAVIVSPDGENLLWYAPQNEERILSLIALAKKHWNIDPNRILITGYSNGGNGSWYFAENYPQIFHAAIPMASAYTVNSKIKVPLYVIHGGKDELFDVNRTQKWTNVAIEKGSLVKFSVNPELSHYMACAYVDNLKKAVKWLEEIKF